MSAAALLTVVLIIHGIPERLPAAKHIELGTPVQLSIGGQWSVSEQGGLSDCETNV